MQHPFIFTPGEWAGQGKILLRPTNIQIDFVTHWKISEEDNGKIVCEQRVEKLEFEETNLNIYTFYDITEASFQVSLSVQEIGQVEGIGKRDPYSITWEYDSESKGLVGRETYKLQKNGEYLFHAEYSQYDNFVIIINGVIWQHI